MMSKEQQSKRKVITVKGVTRVRNTQFITEIFEAFEAGYVPAPKGSQWTADAPVLLNNKKVVVLYPKDYEVPAPSREAKTLSDADEDAIAAVDKQIMAEIEKEQKGDLSEDDQVVVDSDESKATLAEAEGIVDLTEEVNSLTKKKPLLDFASKVGIDVPSDKKVPAAIKQHILSKLGE